MILVVLLTLSSMLFAGTVRLARPSLPCLDGWRVRVDGIVLSRVDQRQHNRYAIVDACYFTGDNGEFTKRISTKEGWTLQQLATFAKYISYEVLRAVQRLSARPVTL